MEYRVLGEVAVARAGEALDLAGKQRALLALLLIDANRVVSTDRIIDELWDDSGQDRQNALWVVISRLRGLLEPDRAKRTDGTILVTRPPGYMLVVDPEQVDSIRFETLAREGRALIATDPAAASLVLNEALSLWRGHAYEEFTYEAFAEAEIARLTELRLATVEDRIDADLAAGRCHSVVSELESLVRQHPQRERLAAQFMLALHQSGRQGEALRAFAAYRLHLADELGLDPSETIVRLEQRIITDDPSLRAAPTAEPTGPALGLTVRGYELRELIGSGATGNVFTAYQPSVGREVAIKVVRPEMANDPDFIRRFEAEARQVAGLEHPRIVPVYDYWREADGAYLVMRRFEGGNLRTLLDGDSSLPLDARHRIVEQVGGALAVAHERGVTHGDLRPANVLIDEHGDAYLADFGLSYDITTSERGATGFMAPEQADEGLPSLRGDVFSLASLVEALVGDELNPRVRAVVERGRSPDPGDRFADATSFLAAYDVASGREPATVPGQHAPNPYRGLEAFHEANEAMFFGRERLIERLLTHIGAAGPSGRFIAVVGPSGSGKSSVVRAGLIPALRRGAVPGSERWFVATTIPGRNPFASLADALRTVAVNPPDDLAEQLRSAGIAPVTRRLLADDTAQLVLVVDQLEELFVQSEPGEANEFLDAIAAAVNDRHSVVRVVATLRADFYDAPLRHREFGELMRLGTDAITPLNASELERAITGPAEMVGVAVEAGVVAEIAADMDGQPTALPLMQFALTELYERRTGSAITSGDYRELGGLASALALRADAVLGEFSPAQQADARHAFLRLVTLTDGAADTRRRALLAELTSSSRGDVSPVLDAFVAHRLLSVDRDPVTRGPTVEIAHEALLTEWATLREWIDDARGDLHQHRRLASAASDWLDADEQTDFLMPAGQLGAYADWAPDSPVRLTYAEQRYLDASRHHADAELVVERRRTRRLRRLVAGVAAALVIALIAGGAALIQSRRADDEAQRASDAAATAEQQRDIAEAQTALADEQRGIAETQSAAAQEQAEIAGEQRGIALAQTDAANASARLADLERIRAQAVAETERNPPLAALLAVESYNVDPSHRSAGAIQQVLTGIDGRQATMFDTVADYGGRNVISADRTVVAAGSSNAVDVWDVDSRSLLLRVDSQFADFDLSADASLLAVKPTPTARSVDLYDVTTQQPLGTIEASVCFVIRFAPGNDQVALVTTPSDAAFGCDDSPRQLEIWDVSDPANPRREHVNDIDNVWEVWWSPDGASYVTASANGFVRAVDASTHAPIWSHQFETSETSSLGGAVRPTGALFTTDGRQVVVGVQFEQVSGILLFTFDTKTGDITREPTSTAGLGSMNWWDEERAQIVGTLWPSGATVLDLDQGAEVLPPPFINPNATGVWIDRERDRTIVASFVGIEVYSLDGSSVLERRVSLTPEQLAIKAETDGQVFASLTSDGDHLWTTALDFANRVPIIEWDMTTDPPQIVQELPAAWLIYAQGDSTLTFRLDTMQVLGSDREEVGPAVAIEAAERGQPYLWRASFDGSRHAPLRVGTNVVDIYDTASGERIAEIDWPGNEQPGDVVRNGPYSISADGAYIVTHWLDADGTIAFIHNTTTGEVVQSGRPDEIGELLWLGDDTVYINPPGSFDLERRDIETLEISGPPLVGHTLILNSMIDDPDSDRIVTQATNGNVRVWDRETGEQIGREIAIGRQAAGTDTFSARDGDLVGVILDTGVAIWNYDIETWPDLACAIAGRNMTRSEWDDFGPQGEPYRVTCPQFPAAFS